MKQTAVEWFVEQLKINNYISDNAHWLIDEAKEMEKEQQGYSEEEVLKFSEWFAFELTHYGYPTEENIIKALNEIKRILKTNKI
jgi:hypothetical protein